MLPSALLNFISPAALRRFEGDVLLIGLLQFFLPKRNVMREGGECKPEINVTLVGTSPYWFDLVREEISKPCPELGCITCFLLNLFGQAIGESWPVRIGTRIKQLTAFQLS